MYKKTLYFSVSAFRCRSLAWMMAIVFCVPFVPSVGLAQQPTAAITSLTGEVQISGQAANAGDMLQAGDSIGIKTGGSVVLALSDGSELHLGQNTQLNIADLRQTSSGARVSGILLFAGWLRAFLSPGHQKENSSFTVETPNAQVGVRFSHPDVEISYDPARVETIGIAHTVELLAKNLLTDEEVLVPVGSSVIITGSTIKVVAGILAITESGKTAPGQNAESVAEQTSTETSSAETGQTAESASEPTGTETSHTETGKTAKGETDSTSEVVETEAAGGIGKGTMIAIGVGTAVAIGGGIAVAADSDDGNSDIGNSDNGNVSDESDVSFTGEFVHTWAEDRTADLGRIDYYVWTLDLVQDGNVVTGTFELIKTFGDCCSVYAIAPISGTVNGGNAVLSSSEALKGSCDGDGCSEDFEDPPRTFSATLSDNGQILRCGAGGLGDFIRQ